ncbi:MAG: PIN domain-containing protein [Planctomycetia bacterium]|nr:PIN domain-containing protein [Planctomycetia bacterium]
MSVNYTVQAQVVDIQADAPKSTDAVLIDTNVWFWISYLKAGGAAYQTQHYPAYVKKARQAGATLFRCELSLAELAHNIERVERETFEIANPGMKPPHWNRSTGWMKNKEYRHNYPGQRATVAAEVQAAWSLVKTMAGPLPMTVDEPAADAALTAFQSQPVDGYDLFILQAASKGSIIQVLTDDGDYCTVPGIQVFTANSNVIAAAQAQGKLLVR